ncbi:MAG: excinuclease ABC subunit UvrC [Gammaproteobacteria bacterium]|nr:excinuclease ABC subunit UvrC [Gammaproteobacteria bacterium]
MNTPVDNSPRQPFDAQAFLKTVTTRSGVYRMYDADDKILYVGKAKNLKNRLSSYFRSTGLTPKTRVLVSHIAHIEVMVTHTEGEALILESNLIKEFHPRYNILLRDDKSYPYIYVSDTTAYPGLALHRGARKKPGRYLGPYPNAHAARDTINLLQRTFKIRQCEDSYFRNRSRPCLQYQIQRCSAPCVGYISEHAYKQDIHHALLFLEGKSQQIISELVADMEKAAGKQNYEKAAMFRDQIRSLQKIAEQQNISAEKGDIDVIACASEGGQACVTVFYIRNGLNLGNRNFFPSLPESMSSEAILAAFIPQFYLDREIPAEIILSAAPDEQALLEEVLSKQAGRNIKLRTQVRSERARWLEMAAANAANTLTTRLMSRTGLMKRFEALQELLQLDSLPTRLECFDISHTMGESTVASCVVMTPEGAFKTDYRRYNIKDITGGDDYAAMRQALERRFRAGQDEAKLPDILLIDGGKGQLRQAIEVFDALAITSVLLIGVAKGEGRKAGLEKLVFSDGRPELHLTLDSPALNLILQVRDEAHRFAITGHRAQRAKTRNESPLEAIPGLGPKRRQTLLKHFGGLQGITRAGVADLAKIPGISKKLAQAIYDEFHINQ